MERIHWDVIPISGSYVFVKRLGPLSFAKLQRPENIDIKGFLALQKRLHTAQFFLEPSLSSRVNGKIVSDATRDKLLMEAGFRQTHDHHAYTKTLVCDISGSEAQILKSFSKTLSYKMRRSLRMDVVYDVVPFVLLTRSDKQHIQDLHASWSKEKKVCGYTDAFLHAMWEEMTKEGTMILARYKDELVGALFLYAHHRVGMYFYQFSSRMGRDKLFVPSGLAYHAIIEARRRGCDVFDLCSAYDERYPNDHRPWLGFTRHKLEFHPTPIYYPPAFVRQFHLSF